MVGYYWVRWDDTIKQYEPKANKKLCVLDVKVPEHLSREYKFRDLIKGNNDEGVDGLATDQQKRQLSY